MTTEAPHAVGAPVPRVDGPGKVTGDASYAADVPAEGTLWAKPLRSPHAHARILSIDTSRARAVPGVHAVVTGDDLPPNSRWGRKTVDVPLLAQGVVRFPGEQVAVVVADDEETAERAVALIDVAYEELPAVIDPEEAMLADATLIHPDVVTYDGLVNPLDAPSNVVCRFEWSKGDVEEGFKDAELIVENTYTTPKVHQGYIETHNQLV